MTSPPRSPGRSPGEAGRVGRLALARLYVVTPDASPERLVQIAAAAVRGGADIIQLRHKTLPRGELLTLARRLRELFPIHGEVPGRRARTGRTSGQAGGWGGPLFIVNDHVDIAVLSGADGVHLGPNDLSIGAARRVGGDRLLIGASASTVETARAAVAAGADYIGCGAAFTTPVKREREVIGPQGVALVVRALAPVPVFAIGGIDESNVEQLTAMETHRACVIRAVADARDPEQAARRLRAMLTR